MYGVGGIPHAQFQGVEDVVGGGTNMVPSYTAAYENYVDLESPFSINISVDYQVDQAVVNADVTVTGAVDPEDENEIYFLMTYNFADDYACSVQRYAAQEFSLEEIGENQLFSETFETEESWNIENVAAIAIIQKSNGTTGNYPIHQSAIKKFPFGIYANFDSDVQSGPGNLLVQFLDNSSAPTGLDTWEWDFENDGTIDSNEPSPSHTYSEEGTYSVALTVHSGDESITYVAEDYITVTNSNNVSGNVAGTWIPSNNPYVLTSETSIPSGSTLNIEPGVEILSEEGVELIVNGKINAVGSTEFPIKIGSDSNWKGILIEESQEDNIISRCEISNAITSAIKVTNGKADIFSNLIYDNNTTSESPITVLNTNDVAIYQNMIANNNCSNTAAGIYLQNSTIDIYNNIIVNNTGMFGAFSMKEESNPILTNNTISNNISTNGTPYLFFIFDSAPTIENSIIVDDNADLFFAPYGPPTVNYTCLTGGYEGTNNIDSDPMFINPSENYGSEYIGYESDWNLETSSPCIDAGNPASEYNDLDGTVNDMGAFGGPTPYVTNIVEYPAPFNLSAQFDADSGQVQLIWDAPDSDDFTSYKLFRNDELLSEDITEESYTDSDITQNTEYSYYVTAIYDGGESEPSNSVTILVTSENDIEGITQLHSNYPNPFSNNSLNRSYATKIDFDVKTDNSDVLIEIYNTKGQKIKTLIDETLNSGFHSVEWSGMNEKNQKVATGIYFYKMKSGRYTSTKKMILIK